MLVSSTLPKIVERRLSVFPEALFATIRVREDRLGWASAGFGSGMSGEAPQDLRRFYMGLPQVDGEANLLPTGRSRV